MSKARLGVNIDHVATLREARGEDYPSLVEAARVSLEAGADQITIHLREDRRHIQDYDVPAVKLVTDNFGVPLNFEMGASSDIIGIAIDIKPAWICLVPEKREEKTTEGGLNLRDKEPFERIKKTCEQLKAQIPDVKISLFVEANKETLERCIELKVDAVEIHTGDYAIDFNEGNDVSQHLKMYENAHKQMTGAGIGFHAGHGLSDESLKPLVEQGLFVEYNIGHWIICRSVFDGLSNTVKKLNQILNKGL
jgi:pyridoxine 5-phosphate synthase